MSKIILTDFSEEEFFRKLGDFLDSRIIPKEQSTSHSDTPHRLVYGLRGIQDLFGCSHKTAQHLKDHVICEAVSQNGRKIVVDEDLALKLFNEKQSKNVR